jgi:hypothetical protein
MSTKLPAMIDVRATSSPGHQSFGRLADQTIYVVARHGSEAFIRVSNDSVLINESNSVNNLFKQLAPRRRVIRQFR